MQTAEFDDYVGVESCADLKSEFDAPPRCNGRSRRSRRESADKEFPPAIPWLARTENQPSHMPWVMRKYTTDDGRVIIREERVPRHEFFKAYRSSGRLVLKLVPLDDIVEESCYVRRLSGDGCDEGIRDPTAEEADDFCKYNGRGMTSCGGFAVDAVDAAAALRPPVST